ncbi:MAG: hypothetical protein KBC81_00995 [Candidatus Pacebacteria bacterium]|nr:hypothetical protein [Candidatus Paceibacterota bacterium]
MTREGSEQRITVHRKRAERLYTALLDQLEQKRYPFNQEEVQVPQAPHFLPKSLELGGRLHSLFLFCACYHMSGIESEVAFFHLGRMYEKYPDFFRPEYIVKNNISADVVASALSEFRLNYKAYVNGRAWVDNSHKLHAYWDDDPCNLFRGTKSYNDLLRNIRNKGKAKIKDERYRGMMGFQHKMVSMLAYFLTDADLVQLDYLYPFPVDIHHLRIHIANKLVTIADDGPKTWYTKNLLGKIRKLSVWYCRKHGMTSSNKLADAIWLLSKYLCSQHPGNSATINRWPHKKGEKQYMGRNRKVTLNKIEWTLAQVAAYNRSCGSCEISSTCKTLVPAAFYYVKGTLQEAGPRLNPPQQYLLAVHTPKVRPTQKGQSGNVRLPEFSEKQLLLIGE